MSLVDLPSFATLSKIWPNLDFFLNSIASKKGTTQAGVNFLKSQNINKIIYTTLNRAYKRAKEIGIEK